MDWCQQVPTVLLLGRVDTMAFTVETSNQAMPKATRNRASLPDEVVKAIEQLMDPENSEVQTLRIPGEGKLGTKNRADSARANASKVTHYMRTRYSERVGAEGSPEKVTTQYLSDEGKVLVGVVERTKGDNSEGESESDEGTDDNGAEVVEGADDGTQAEAAA